MSIEAMKQSIEALNEAVAFREGGRQKAIDAINALRTAIQQAEPKHRHWSEALADDLTESGDIQTNAHPAPGVPDDVVRGAISTVREQYRGTDWGKAAECICDAIDAAMLADK